MQYYLQHCINTCTCSSYGMDELEFFSRKDQQKDIREIADAMVDKSNSEKLHKIQVINYFLFSHKRLNI